MLRVHIPNSNVVASSMSPTNFHIINCEKDKWTIAKKVVAYDRVVWDVLKTL